MLRHEPKILYVGAKLPARSETFVYREVIELQNRHIRVATASVHPPERHLGEGILDELAETAIPIYGSGMTKVLVDALTFTSRRPLRGLATLLIGFADAVCGRAVPFSRRPKLLVQCLAGLALANRCRDQHITHIHAHMAHVPTSIAMYAANALNVPFSFTGHAADLFRDFSLLPAKLARAKFASCISRWHREYYQSIVVHLPNNKLPVIRCGVDTSAFTVKHQAQENEIPKILSVGRLVEKKGFDTLIKACGIMARSGRTFVCTIVGDGPEAKALEDLIALEKLGSFVQLAGTKSNKEIQNMLSDSDLFVLPCRAAKSGDRDGIPVVLMEAMACGVPVVSGDLITIRELIQHHETGMMVQPENIDELASTLTDLMENPILRIELGQSGRQKIEQEFSLHANVDRLVEAIRQTVDSKTPMRNKTASLWTENTAS